MREGGHERLWVFVRVGKGGYIHIGVGRREREVEEVDRMERGHSRVVMIR